MRTHATAVSQSTETFGRERLLPGQVDGQNVFSGFLATEDAAERPAGLRSSCLVALRELVDVKQRVWHHGVGRHLRALPPQVQPQLSAYGCRRREDTEWENPELHCGHLFACIYTEQTDYNVHSKKKWIDHISYIKATKDCVSITELLQISTFKRKLWQKEFAEWVSFGSLAKAQVEKGQTCLPFVLKAKSLCQRPLSFH